MLPHARSGPNGQTSKRHGHYVKQSPKLAYPYQLRTLINFVAMSLEIQQTSKSRSPVMIGLLMDAG
jgi:hypothetical protein